MEISITERLGHITVRDDYETIDDSVYNARVLSTVHDNVTMETSSLLFPKMDPDGNYRIVALDSIDEDELYPYNSSKWVRKDVSATVVFTTRKKTSVNGVEGELIVSMRGSVFLKIHRPQFAIPENIQQELATGIMAWGDVMVKSIRSIVYGACQAEDTKLPDETKSKRRRCTYAARREEAKRLREELRGLESEVTVLKYRSGHGSYVDPELQQVEMENGKLSQTARKQHLEVAKGQSAMSRCLGTQQSHPLYTRICLPKDWGKRRNKLVSIREEKLRNAYDFVMDPRHYVDPAKAQYCDERFETTEGDFCGVRFETVQFSGVKSLQQVYDAAVYYLTNMEISITECLGHITVRDDYETINGSVYNARVLSTVLDNVTMETSSLLFPKMDPDGKYGMVVLDSIDQDELYPYNSAERVRKDVSATAVFTVGKDDTGELVVTMRRAAFLKIHRPQFSLSEDALQELAMGIMAWGDVMLKTVRSMVYGSTQNAV
ncbi:hypothetical protein PC116_g3810 [Phytophthora cactorum]|nr:hypothetical protein PC116_g3810 [Phytophthora cactorum]